MNRVMNALASLKFGIILLVIIALAGVFSTLIPQGEPVIYYQAVYGHALGSLFYYSALTEVLTSPWFFVSVLLLLVNLSLCTGKRFFKNLSVSWSAYGSTILHLGLISIIVGGLMSSYLGRSDYLEIPVQGTVVTVINGQPFQLKVEDFNIDYYQGEQQLGPPKQYRTQLTVLENAQPVNSQEIYVNKPLQHQGVKIYQSSYGWMVEGQLNKHDAQPRSFSVVAGQPMEVDGEYKLAVIPVSEGGGGDFLYKLIHGGQTLITGRAVINEPVSLPVGTVEFTGLKRYTGLEIRHDPGVPVVWVGFTLLTVGLAIRLFCHRPRGGTK